MDLQEVGEHQNLEGSGKAPKDGAQSSTNGGDSDLQRPHLLFFVCGIQGNPEPFRAVQALIEELKGSKVAVHICRSITGRTHDGIEAGAALIAAEIREHVASLGQDRRPRSLSVWGHSMGGVLLRYALADICDLSTGTACGLEPRFFLTTASPHLGVAATLSPSVLALRRALGMYGRTGEQLCIEDSDALIVNLGTEERYLQPLRLFQYRVLIANVCNDIIVDFCTAALQPRRAPWLMDAPPVTPRYPHVVYDSGSWTAPVHILDRAGPERPSLGASRRREFGAREKFLPVPYYSGHERATELAKARRCLGEMPWRIVCARIDDGIFYENAHRSVCYEAEHDVVHYICEVLMKDPFGAHRRCLSFASAGYGRPMRDVPAARRLRRSQRPRAASLPSKSIGGSPSHAPEAQGSVAYPHAWPAQVLGGESNMTETLKAEHSSSCMAPTEIVS